MTANDESYGDRPGENNNAALRGELVSRTRGGNARLASVGYAGLTLHCGIETKIITLRFFPSWNFNNLNLVCSFFKKGRGGHLLVALRRPRFPWPPSPVTSYPPRPPISASPPPSVAA